MRFPVSREIYLNHCFPLTGRSIIWNGWFLNVIRFPVLFDRLRFLVNLISLIVTPRRSLLYVIYLTVLHLKFRTNWFVSCITRYFLQNRDVPVINSCRLAISPETDWNFINWVKTAGHFSGLQMRVVITMARLDHQRPLGAVQNWGPPSLHIFLHMNTETNIHLQNLFSAFCFGKDISHLSVIKIFGVCWLNAKNS